MLQLHLSASTNLRIPLKGSIEKRTITQQSVLNQTLSPIKVTLSKALEYKISGGS